MLRLTEIKLPLGHTQDEIQAAILTRLEIAPAQLVGYSIFRRAVDARKRSAIHFIYTLDVETHNEAALLKRLKDNRQVTPTPDSSGNNSFGESFARPTS